MAAVGTVLFDLDDTLCTYRRDVDEVLAVAFERAGVESFFDAADWAAVIPEIASADSQASFRRTCFGLLADRCGRDADRARAVADAYGAERDHADVRLLPGAREALDAFGRDARIGLVTNAAPEVQEPKLEALALADTFETVVYAGTETLAKPDPSPFRTALERLDAAPGGAVHVGNSLAADVAGAKGAGLDAVWVPDDAAPASPGDHRPDHTIETLHDLPATLGVGP